MANITFNGKEPRIYIETKGYDLLRAIFSKEKVSVFLNFGREDNIWKVQQIYVPSQSVGTYNIIDDFELGMLGEDFNGVITYRESANSFTEEKFFSDVFFGEKEYVRMVMNKSGKIFADIVLDNIIFHGVSVDTGNSIAKEIQDKAEKLLSESTRKWNSYDGYVQKKRVFYKKPEFIVNNVSWRDVVSDTEVPVDGFKNLCKASKGDMYSWLSRQLQEYYGEKNVVAKDGYICTVGNIPVMFSAHIDTVFSQPPFEFVATKTFSDGRELTTLSSPQGIGGDDRCGIYATLSIMKTLEKDGKKPYIFFSTDEEVGGNTTKKGAKECSDIVKDVRFILALDRAGKQDSVYYECDNKDFKKWIDSFGFVEAIGSRTDICTLCSEWDVAGVNFSVGYYGNHHETEYVKLWELQDTISKCLDIIKDAKEDKIFPYCKKKTKVYSGSYASNYDWYDNIHVGDNVFTRQYEVQGYKSPDFSSPVVNRIPAYTPLVVKAIKKQYCLVNYNGIACWVNIYNVLLDIK